MIKSVRGRVAIATPTVSAGTADRYASGWVGFGRFAQTSITGNDLALQNSEVFGVQPWVATGETTFYMDLNLKGLTLTANEYGFLMGEVHNISNSNTVAVIFQCIYAEHTLPA
jgi:hypothetical protein